MLLIISNRVEITEVEEIERRRRSKLKMNKRKESSVKSVFTALVERGNEWIAKRGQIMC